MRPTGGGPAARRLGRWSWLRIPALAAGLLSIERQLVAVTGTPTAQLRTLRDLGRSPSDPVTPLLAALAFLSEVLIGYVVVVLALRTLGLLPGWIGGLTGRAALLLSPGPVRGVLDLLVGGALLAQATLTALPSVTQGRPPDFIQTMATAWVGSIGSVGSTGLAGPAARMRSAGPATTMRSAGPATRMGPAETRPPSRRLAAPLPPWLGGGPSKPRVGYTVEPGDTLWGIAAVHLEPARRSPARVHRYWQQIYRANRPAIGADPDLIHPGTRLDVPWFGSERR